MAQVSVSPHSILPYVERLVSCTCRGEGTAAYGNLLPEEPILGRPVTYETRLCGPLAAGVGGLTPCEVIEGEVFLKDRSCDSRGCEKRDSTGEAGEVHVDGCETWKA
jgi:hypothetical protein